MRNPINPYADPPSAMPERDVFLVSYPKSGRTWLRFFLMQYLNVYFDLKLSMQYNLLVLNNIIPPEWLLRQEGPKVFSLRNEPAIPRIRATHLAYDPEFFAGKRVIYLSRDVRDVLCSYYFHADKEGRFNGTLSEFVTAKTDEVLAYHQAWKHATAPAEIAHFTYEQMTMNRTYHFERLVAAVGLRVVPSWLDACVSLCDFSVMKRAEQRTGQNISRIRRGRVGGYREYLSKSSLDYIQSRCFLVAAP